MAVTCPSCREVVEVDENGLLLAHGFYDHRRLILCPNSGLPLSRLVRAVLAST